MRATWSEAGNSEMRTLLVQCAQYILGCFGPDTDLKRWGMAIAARGGKNAKRRAIIAVARKRSVLLHTLWTSGAVYDPLYNSAAMLKRAECRGVACAVSDSDLERQACVPATAPWFPALEADAK